MSTGTKKKTESFADCVEVRIGGKAILNENQKKKMKRESAAARGKETLFFGAAPPPETLEELSFETPKTIKANKVHIDYLPVSQAHAIREFSSVILDRSHHFLFEKVRI